MKHDLIKKEFFNNSDNSDYVNYDYWNGIAIKNSFPLDINKNPLKLRMVKYNDRNNYTGYNKIINTLINNFDKRIENFNQTELNNKKDNENNDDIQQIINDPFGGYKPSPHKNFFVKDDFDTKHHDIVVNQKNQNYWNHRINYDNKISWMYQTVPIYENYIKKNNSDSYNLSNYFDYSRNLIVKGPIKNLSVIAMLIYGKTNVTFKMLERLFNFVRYLEYSDNSYNYFQLDNFVIRYYKNPIYDKRYEISWKEDNINDLKFV
jgi:hypothetical protein